MKYQPQLAKLPSKSFDAASVVAPHWVIERKWDGMRALFEIDPESGSTSIFSRTGQDLRPQFPELQELHRFFEFPSILDGEILAFLPGSPLSDRDSVESLELLQMRAGDKQARRRDEIPVEVRFFDILESNGEDTRNYPLHERALLLEEALECSGFDPPYRLEDGEETPTHWEGTIAKRSGSIYSGKRTSDWLKFKFTQRATLRAVGLTSGFGKRLDSFGAVIVADAQGIIRGQVGSGFSDAAIADIMAHTEWDESEGRYILADHFLCEVEYRFLSKTGLMVNTAWKGRRDDKERADTL